MNSKNIFVALDTNLDSALEIAFKTKNYAYGFKIGMTLLFQKRSNKNKKVILNYIYNNKFKKKKISKNNKKLKNNSKIDY